MITNNIKLASIVALLVILAAVGIAQGASTFRVCDCRACGCQYLSIQEAIDKASPGDVVVVRSGTFHENVEVNKPITLRGERWKGLDLPVINARANGSGITVAADGVTVEMIRVTNSGNGSEDAGIRVLSEGSTIRDNHAIANGGAGILLEGARNTTVFSNVASENRRGISLVGSQGSLLFNNRLYNNTEIDAFDDILINRWDDGAIGNFYGSFNCSDDDGDQVCDTLYNIPGGSSADLLPRAG